MQVYVGLYAILLDVVSLLTNLACASRLPIYLACQPHLRKEILATIKHCCLRRSIVQSDSVIESTVVSAIEWFRPKAVNEDFYLIRPAPITVC